MDLNLSKEVNNHFSPYFSKRLIAVFSLVIFFNIFFFHKLGSVFYFLIILALFVFNLMAFGDKEKYKKGLLPIASILGVLVLSGWNLVRTSNFLTNLLLFLVAGYSLSVLIYILGAKIYFVRCLAEAVLAPAKILGNYIRGGFKAIEFVLSSKLQQKMLVNKSKKKHWLKSLFFGLIVGFPVIAILISLLSAGDLVFAKFVENIFTEGFIKNLPARIIESIILLILFLPLVFLKVKREFTSPLNILRKKSFVSEMSVVMVMVAIVIGAFSLVQWPYIFVNVARETDLSNFGVATYSEYVQKGFGELLKAGMLVFLLAWTGLIALKGKREDQKSILKKVQLVVIAEFLIFITSLFRRIWLYQEYHGWTLARIYGGFLLLWIVAMTATLIARHYRQKKWVYAEVAMTAMLIIFLGYFNSEKFIVKNKPPTVNNRVDYIYLARMSSDGVEGWKEAYKYADKILADSNLINKEMLDEDDRRNIAYAGVVLRQLADNYNKLIEIYADDEEFVDYYKEILKFENEVNERHVEWQRRKIVKEKPENPEAEEAYWVKYIIRDIDEINKILKELDEGKSIWEIGYRIILNFDSEQILFNNSRQVGFYYADFVDDYDRSKFKKYDNLDKFLVYNKSEAKGFEVLQDEIGLDELINLQKKFWELYIKIMEQNPEERDYEHDVSLESPFLE